MKRDNILYLALAIIIVAVFSFSQSFSVERSRFLAAVTESGAVPAYFPFTNANQDDRDISLFYSFKAGKNTKEFPLVVNYVKQSRSVYLYPTSYSKPTPDAVAVTIPHEGENIEVWGTNIYSGVPNTNVVVTPYISPNEGVRGQGLSDNAIVFSPEEALRWQDSSGLKVIMEFGEKDGSFEVSGVATTDDNNHDNLFRFGQEKTIQKQTQYSNMNNEIVSVEYDSRYNAIFSAARHPVYDKSARKYYVKPSISMGPVIFDGDGSPDLDHQGTVSNILSGTNLENAGFAIIQGSKIELKKFKYTGDAEFNPGYIGSVKAMSVSKPNSGGNPLEGIADGSEMRNRMYLALNDVYVNKLPHPGSTNSTEIETIAKVTLDKIITLKKESGAEVVITGGTEIGHKTHGKGKQIVDIRKNTTLDNFIINQAGKDISKNSLGNITYYIRSGAFVGAYTNETIGGSAAHWHVVYGGDMPAPQKAEAVKKEEMPPEKKKDDKFKEPVLPIKNNDTEGADPKNPLLPGTGADESEQTKESTEPKEEIRRALDPKTGVAIPATKDKSSDVASDISSQSGGLGIINYIGSAINTVGEFFQRILGMF